MLIGKYILECMPGDYLANNAFQIIYEKSEILEIYPDIYAVVFLKCDIYGEVSGNKFKRNHYKTTMFELCLKDEAGGNIALLFNKDIREKFKHDLKKRENYIPENRMYFKMDKKYKIICFNMPLMITFKNNTSADEKELLINNPMGYTKYYEEILNNEKIKHVKLSKKKYLIKQYIMSSILSNKREFIKNLKFLNIRFIARMYHLQIYFATKKIITKHDNKNDKGKRMKNS